MKRVRGHLPKDLQHIEEDEKGTIEIHLEKWRIRLKQYLYDNILDDHYLREYLKSTYISIRLFRETPKNRYKALPERDRLKFTKDLNNILNKRMSIHIIIMMRMRLDHVLYKLLH